MSFTIKSIEAVGEKDLTKLTGAERKVTLRVKGDFLLHKKTSEKVAEVELASIPFRKTRLKPPTRAFKLPIIGTETCDPSVKARE